MIFVIFVIGRGWETSPAKGRMGWLSEGNKRDGFGT